MRLYYRCSCVSPRRHKPLFTIIVARSRDILRINSFVFAFRHPSCSDFSSYLRFSPGSYCFYPTHVIPMQLYQDFWQLRVFSFFTRRVTSIKFRHFRINIGYDYFHISLFLIFVYFLYLFILSYLPYFYFFYKYEIDFLISIPRFLVIFFRNFSMARHHNLHKEAHNKLLFTCSSVRAEETRNVYEILSLFPAPLASSRNVRGSHRALLQVATSFLEFRLRSYL